MPDAWVTDPGKMQDHLVAIGVYAAVEVALMALVSFFVAPAELKQPARTTFINNVVSIPIAFFLAGSAAVSVSENYATTEARKDRGPAGVT